MELAHKMETIQVMCEIDRSILSTLESQEILDTASRNKARVILCQKATVSIADEQRQGFNYVAGFGVSLSKGMRKFR